MFTETNMEMGAKHCTAMQSTVCTGLSYVKWHTTMLLTVNNSSLGFANMYVLYQVAEHK